MDTLLPTSRSADGKAYSLWRHFERGDALYLTWRVSSGPRGPQSLISRHTFPSRDKTILIHSHVKFDSAQTSAGNVMKNLPTAVDTRQSSICVVSVIFYLFQPERARVTCAVEANKQRQSPGLFLRGTTASASISFPRARQLRGVSADKSSPWYGMAKRFIGGLWKNPGWVRQCAPSWLLFPGTAGDSAERSWQIPPDQSSSCIALYGSCLRQVQRMR